MLELFIRLIFISSYRSWLPEIGGIGGAPTIIPDTPVTLVSVMVVLDIEFGDRGRPPTGESGRTFGVIGLATCDILYP